MRASAHEESTLTTAIDTAAAMLGDHRHHRHQMRGGNANFDEAKQ